MTKDLKAAFTEGTRLIFEVRARFSRHVTYKTGVVVRVHKNGNFRVQYDGAPVIDDGQWNPSITWEKQPEARRAGPNYNQGTCYPDTVEKRAAMQGRIDASKVSNRWFKALLRIEKMRETPDGTKPAEAVRFATLCVAVEAALKVYDDAAQQETET